MAMQGTLGSLAVTNALQPASSAKQSLISISHLSKKYQVRYGEPVLAIDDISIDVAEGEFVALVGPSGCGKSTLLQILAGILPATSGDILFNGQKLTRPRRDVGIVFQEPVLLPWRTVLDNVMLPAVVHGLNREQYRQKAEELLKLVKLEGWGGRYPFELSGGMSQRASIARALLVDPAMILMDEPFGALDAMTREQMNLELLRIWSRAQKTVLLITHSIQEAVFLADRVVVLTARPGRVIDVVDIDLPRPRTMDMMAWPAFGAAGDRIRKHLMATGDLG
jgi:NitT/TauT family transport system ATP-binding protein